MLVQEQQCALSVHKTNGRLDEVEEEEGDCAYMEATGCLAEEGAIKTGGKRKEKQLERGLREIVKEDEDLVEWLQSGNLPTEALDLLNAFIEWQCTV